MTKLMETLYDYILDNTLERYYNETASMNATKSARLLAGSSGNSSPRTRNSCWRRSSGPMTARPAANWRPCSLLPLTSGAP